METISIRVVIEQEETGIRGPLIISCQDHLLSFALSFLNIPLYKPHKSMSCSSKS